MTVHNNRSSIEQFVVTGGLTGTGLGGIIGVAVFILGLIHHYPIPIILANLPVCTAVYGAIGGALLGLIIGSVYHHCKDKGFHGRTVSNPTDPLTDNDL